MNKEDFRENVYENWRESNSWCDGCELRDCNLHPDTSPDFGGMNFDADIMLVNESPGFMSDDSKFAEKGRKRRFRDTPKEAFENRGYEIKSPLKSIDEKILVDSNSYNSDEYNDPYTWALIEKWMTLDRLKKYLFSDDGGALDISIKEIYYTNSTKCPLLSNNDNCNEEGRKTCLEYLKQEIEHVQPELVVAGGNSAVKSVAEAIGKGEIANKKIVDLIEDTTNSGVRYAAHGDNPALIPCYQFSNGLQNCHWVLKRWSMDVEDGKKQRRFFEEMAKRIIHELDDAGQS